ncbi:cupin domain-containing protein [Comamonas testosteroni]
MSGTSEKTVSIVHWPARTLVNPFIGKPSRPISGDTEYQTMHVFEGLGGKVSSGTWQSTAGTFRSNIVGYIEFCYIVEGACRLVDPDGTVHAFGVGDHFIMPEGWTGHWEVDEFVKKVYMVAEA